MEINAWRAADNEPPMPYDEMESMLKEMMIDNGFSGEVQTGNMRPLDNRQDKLSSLENKVSALENRYQKRPEPPNTNNRAVVNGKDVCHKFNSAEGNNELS